MTGITDSRAWRPGFSPAVWRRGFSPAVWWRTFSPALIVAALGVTSAAAPPPFDTKAVDAVFADYDKPATPGCMVGVLRAGEIVYSRGYGRANLEHDVAFTTGTVFDIGSTSKQVVAAAVVLLAQDGKLTLDDDIRKHLPGMPDYGTTITIRHLLTHTSGLRDYINLMLLGGWQFEDLTTPAQAFDVVRRQKGLDFEPDTEFSYSNTGFFLASLIVERASGKPLGAFARERLFQPLGMTATRYMDDHAAMVPRRATGYQPEGDGFEVSVSDWEQLGDGAVQTSVDDISKWDANFYTARVGGRAMIDALTTVHRLKSGAATTYGLGLFVDEYRGLPVVRHGGSWAGYRAELLRFPAERLSIAVLCNRGEANAETRADRVADVVLQGRFPKPVPPARAKPQPADTRSLAKFAGVYWNAERMEILRFEMDEHGLALVGDGGLRPLAEAGEGTFAASGLRVRFVDASPRRVERLGRGGALTALTAAEAWNPDAATLDLYTGTWVSEELQARWVFERDGDALVVKDLRSTPRRWTPAVRDVFTSSFLVLTFVPRDGVIDEMRVGAGRARGMRFVRQR
jgi:CubicO group peptidase (beta-lactamase class C family)